MNVCDFFYIFVNSLVCLILGPNKFFIPPILRKLVLIPYYHLKRIRRRIRQLVIFLLFSRTPVDVMRKLSEFVSE